MTRGELLARHSSHALTELMAYEAIESFPAERNEVMLAQIAQILANTNRRPGSDPLPLAAFLPFREQPELTEEEIADRVLRALGGAG